MPLHQEAYESFLDELNLLLVPNQCLLLVPDQWPTDKPGRYGELEIEKLCRRFKLSNTTKPKPATGI